MQRLLGITQNNPKTTANFASIYQLCATLKQQDNGKIKI